MPVLREMKLGADWLTKEADMEASNQLDCRSSTIIQEILKGGHQEDPTVEMAIQLGYYRVWQSIPHACSKSGLQEVSGYPQQD